MAKKRTKSKHKSEENLNQQSTLWTAHVLCVHITVHNCCTRYTQNYHLLAAAASVLQRLYKTTCISRHPQL